MALSLQPAATKLHKYCPTKVYDSRIGEKRKRREKFKLDIPGYIPSTSTTLPPNNSFVVSKKNKFPPCKQSSSL